LPTPPAETAGSGPARFV